MPLHTHIWGETAEFESSREGKLVNPNQEDLLVLIEKGEPVQDSEKCLTCTIPMKLKEEYCSAGICLTEHDYDDGRQN